MEALELEMELDSDDDQLIIATKTPPRLVQMDDVIAAESSRDTQPIITVDQAELNEGVKSRRRLVHLLVIAGVVFAFVVALGLSLFLIIYFSKS